MLSPVYYYWQLQAFPSNLLQLKANSFTSTGINGLISNGFVSHGYEAKGWLFAAGCCCSAGSNPSGYSSTFSLPCESFLMGRTFNNLSHSLSLMYSLLFNQVWVHTVSSPLAMRCPDLLTSIQLLLFMKPSGTIIIFETSHPSVKFGWNWPTSSISLQAASQTCTKRWH